MRLIYHSLFPAIIALTAFISTAHAVDFKKDIQPILKDHCVKCHGGPRAKAKIRYDNPRYLAELIGTDKHAIIVPGKPELSKVYLLSSKDPTEAEAMPPPRRGKPLNTAEKALIRKWIEEGASLEDTTTSDTKTTSPTAAPDKNKVHEWVNLEGKKLKATFVAIEGVNVKLRMENGNEILYPATKLSAESKALAVELSK